jgi:TP901 family phage tail tape measure protein
MILESSGTAGSRAYNQFASNILNTNIQIKQSNKLLNDMATTLGNTLRYGISSRIVNSLVGSIEQAFNYTKRLDSSLNDIRIVTGLSADNMEKFAKQANDAAKSLGASTLDYTNASLIYYQQGLSDAEVAARAETTIKAANVTGQTGEAVSEQLTAVWNGYKVTAEETELYVDKLAAVAATTAADLEELSVGMSKVASAANAMGVDFDDLNAQIATIVSVTRQAPESVGTALKTIYARLGDLSVEGGVDEFGVSLGKVSEQMQQMGIQILDQKGNLRDMTSVIAEVAEKWQGWTEAQKQAAAPAHSARGSKAQSAPHR